jgi:hypothetical protein
MEVILRDQEQSRGYIKMALRELGLEDLNWIKCADPMMSI